MNAQPMKKCRQPTWQSVKGTLIHRCVLAAGGKWLTARDAARLSDLFNEPDSRSPLDGPAVRSRTGATQ